MAIGFSAITPVLVAGEASNFWIALLPALAAIAAGLVSLFQCRDHWVRGAYTAETLKSELHCFETGSGDFYKISSNADEAITKFVLRVEQIVLDETAEWRKRALSGDKH